MSGKQFILVGIFTFLVVGLITYAASVGKSKTSSLPSESSLIESNESSMPVTEQANLKQYNVAPQMMLLNGVDYKALVKTTMGDIKIDLFEKDAPITVNNFVFLAKEGFYNDVIFHRVIKDFMVQGGDPLGLGMGGPGYQFSDEFNAKKLVRGSLAMANAGPNTNGSQFFIVTAEETPWLDGKHTNFGQVIEGLDVVMSMEGVETDQRDKPLKEIKIISIEIIEE